MAVDPICKMEVDKKKAKYTSDYKGKKYYFCASGCKTMFDKNPEKYSDTNPQSKSGCCCCSGC